MLMINIEYIESTKKKFILVNSPYRFGLNNIMASNSFKNYGKTIIGSLYLHKLIFFPYIRY